MKLFKSVEKQERSPVQFADIKYMYTYLLDVSFELVRVFSINFVS